MDCAIPFAHSWTFEDDEKKKTDIEVSENHRYRVVWDMLYTGGGLCCGFVLFWTALLELPSTFFLLSSTGVYNQPGQTNIYFCLVDSFFTWSIAIPVLD